MIKSTGIPAGMRIETVAEKQCDDQTEPQISGSGGWAQSGGGWMSGSGGW